MMRWKLIFCRDGMCVLTCRGRSIAESNDPNILLSFFGEITSRNGAHALVA